MKVELVEVHWLEERSVISLAELAQRSGLGEDELAELIALGALAPVDPAAQPRHFRAESLVIARTACRLRDDFDLDLRSLALAMSLLERIRDLEAQVCELRARLPKVY